MIYSQFKENERSDRFEVRVQPGYDCTIADANAASAWKLSKGQEPYWVDFESELERILQRAEYDYGLSTGDTAGAEFLERVANRKSDLYDSLRTDSFLAHDYLAQLGILNLAEYFRLQRFLKRLPQELERNTVLGSNTNYTDMRTRAVEFDLAELAEWLVAHGVGLPKLELFFEGRPTVDAPPTDVKAVEETAPVKKKRKKGEPEEAAPVAAAPQPPATLPNALFYIAELYRLHQATENDLLQFVDQVMHDFNLTSPTEAIEMIRAEAAPWIDIVAFEQRYRSYQKEMIRETARAQAALLRQHEAFSKKSRRGDRGPLRQKSQLHSHDVRDSHANDLSPLEEFTRSMEIDRDAEYEAAMNRALAEEGGEDEAGVEELAERQYGPNVSVEYREGATEAFEGVEEGELFGGSEEGAAGFEVAETEHAESGEETFGYADRYAGEFAEQEFEGAFSDRDQFGADRGFVGRPAGGQNGRRPMEQRQGEPRQGDSRQGGFRNGRPPRHSRKRQKGRDAHPPQGGGRNQPRANEHQRGARPGPHPADRHAPDRQPPARGKQRGDRPRGRSGGQVDFDEVQPMSNYSPGLPPASAGGAAGAPPKRPRWKGKR